MIDLWLFAPACLALNLTFGPSNLLALTHGAQRGVGFACAAALGRMASFAPMIALSGLGLGVLLSASAAAFTLAKLAGAGYLIWLGWKLWRAPAPEVEMVSGTGRRGLIPATRREALVALGNPKAILIFAAFFPQFVDPNAYWTSYAIVGGVFLLLEMVAVAAYALAGQVAARRATQHLGKLHKLSGATMMIFGLALALARKPGAA
ncbi:LysE family translocator [Primorskyibacter aestuariivivens]|uniref:LysE family translocator n=1 Tax=Primorskyibacter aestuariivivens TaxID=1888912 RepID=UPI002300D1CB|nr:LysE family translocator [Primorskyibacter aestuariivivens]MDA7428757.1 LysE family translocator [Primorskyibacter aestuariivivens]